MYFLLKMGDSKKYQVSFQGCRRPFHQQLPPFHQQLPYLPFISAQDFGPASPQSAAASFSAPVVPETSDNTDKKATSDSRDSCLGSYLCKSYFPSLPNTDREDRCFGAPNTSRRYDWRMAGTTRVWWLMQVNSYSWIQLGYKTIAVTCKSTKTGVSNG